MQRKIQMDMEALRKRRQDEMRRRAAVHLAEQRRMDKSCELEAQQEAFWKERRAREQRTEERKAAAYKKHIAENEQHRQQVQERVAREAEEEARALRERWAAQEKSREEHRQQFLERSRQRADLEQRAQRERVELEEKRATARAQAVADYQEARLEGEVEATERARDTIEDKQHAAETRTRAYDKRRTEALSRKHASIREKERQVNKEWSEHLQRDSLIEQQLAENRTIPYRSHEKHRAREAMAPVEVHRIEHAKERRFVAERIASDEVVEENRQASVVRHMEWIAAKHKARERTIRRIEKAQAQRSTRTAGHAEAVRQYELHTDKLEARKQMRDEAARREREAFRLAQSRVGEAVYASQVGMGVISDTQLEAVVASAGGKKKR